MTPTNTLIQNLLVIDNQVKDWQSLVAGVKPDTAVLILDSTRDGLTQLSDYLSKSAYAPLQSLQIISHGSAGSLQLGSSSITTNTLNSYTKQLAAIGSNLTATGDILLYGCDVAAGQSGLDFINQFAALTNADVAASNDLTGSAVLGGNWVLEASTGVIEVEMALYSPKLDNYNGTLTVADITSLSFNSGFSQDGLTPLLSFSVELSSNFSNTNSIQLLYWAVNNEQTWITLTRNFISQLFTATIDLPFYAKSGSYEIRDISVTDNTGTFVEVSQQQLIDRGFNVHTDLVNPLSDDQAPSLDSLSVGSNIIASDGTIHLAFEVNASDSSSGLNKNFVLEIASPSGASLQQWATFDANGHAIVDFSLSPYSASGDYHINTIRLTDLAGNYNDSRSWLNANSTPIVITNPNQDIITPEIQNFALEAVFDPITDRPKIVISGVVTDDISGVKGVYLRMNSPVGSTAFLDTWVYADYYSQPGTNQKTVQLDSYKALTTDFLPGEYSVNFLRLGDAANNEVYLYSQIIQETVRVYFPDPLHNLGQTSVIASNQGDFVFGSDKLDDHLFANAGDDIIYSGLGDDLIQGGLGNDSINGGSGVDTVDYSDSTTSVTVNLTSGVATGGDGTDSLIGVENLIGSSSNDIFFAAVTGSSLTGGLGDDYLFGGAGADILYAGSGNDVVNAGAGNDLIVGGDGEGNDTYAGGDGFDTIKYTSAVADITVNILNGTAFSTAGADTAHIGVDSLSSIEGIIAGNYNDSLIGSDVNNDINGEAGNDSITGGGGNDTINGGDGNDVIDGGDGIDISEYTEPFATFIVTNTKGNSSVNDGKYNDTLTNVERLLFSDTSIALDFQQGQNGHLTAMMIGTAFGASKVSAYFAAGVSLYDAGQTNLQVATLIEQLGLIESQVGSTSNTAWLDFVYKNVVGVAPDSASEASYVNALNNGTYTKATLLALAAGVADNGGGTLATQINLVGLQANGLSYHP